MRVCHRDGARACASLSVLQVHSVRVAVRVRVCVGLTGRPQAASGLIGRLAVAVAFT